MKTPRLNLSARRFSLDNANDWDILTFSKQRYLSLVILDTWVSIKSKGRCHAKIDSSWIEFRLDPKSMALSSTQLNTLSFDKALEPEIDTVFSLLHWLRESFCNLGKACREILVKGEQSKALNFSRDFLLLFKMDASIASSKK